MLLSSIFVSFFRYQQELDSVFKNIVQAIMRSFSAGNPKPAWENPSWTVNEEAKKEKQRQILENYGVDPDVLCKLKKPSQITRICKTDYLKEFLDDLERWKNGPEVWKTEFRVGIMAMLCKPVPKKADGIFILEEQERCKLLDLIMEEISNLKSEFWQTLKPYPPLPRGFLSVPRQVVDWQRGNVPLYVRIWIVGMNVFKVEALAAPMGKDKPNWVWRNKILEGELWYDESCLAALAEILWSWLVQQHGQQLAAGSSTTEERGKLSVIIEEAPHE